MLSLGMARANGFPTLASDAPDAAAAADDNDAMEAVAATLPCEARLTLSGDVLSVVVAAAAAAVAATATSEGHFFLSSWASCCCCLLPLPRFVHAFDSWWRRLEKARGMLGVLGTDLGLQNTMLHFKVHLI